MTTPNSAEQIDRLLAGLPPTHTVASQESARLVVGPCGATVILLGERNVPDAADRAARLAAATRTALADHVSWVPFVDAVVVTDDVDRSPTSATVVPPDLLGEVLVEGPEVIDPPALDVIVDLLDTNGLAPWRVGLDSSAAKIDLCEPTPDTNANA
jgi:hypothetical protein